MNRKKLPVSIAIFSVIAIGIAVLAIWPFSEKTPQERYRTRVIVPTVSENLEIDSTLAETMAYEDSYRLKAFLGEGEQVVSVLNYDFDRDSIEEQIVAYRNQYDNEGPIFIGYFAYDGRTYRRMWSAPTAATMPGTISLYTHDLLGDRSVCVIITGMNTAGLHTMTVFHNSPQNERNSPFAKIAEIQMDGSITVWESERSGAYRQGIAWGQPFIISAYGRDNDSENMLDKIEITHEYNQTKGLYEPSMVSRVPGSQIEQRRLKEILSGEPKVFEEFVNDLWYHVNKDGTVDKNQYIYFDPEKREIIFYGDETQQVYAWQNSNATRYGLYIATQNISVSTLRRIVDIEMESLDSIRIRVIEHMRLKIGVSASWDGSYRRAGALPRAAQAERTLKPYTEAVYDSAMGRLLLHGNGEYELSSGGTLTKGRYAFFQVSDSNLLELRPERNSARNNEDRLIYRFSGGETSLAPADSGTAIEAQGIENLILSRVRLGAGGIHDLHEGNIILTKAR